MSRSSVNLPGQTFGRLRVISFHHQGRDRQFYWNCECECGEKCIVNTKSLKSGHTRSCGCLSRDANRTHGMRYTKTWVIWKTMRRRQRGNVCERWMTYENFFDDMGVKPPEHALWRIDWDKPFCKENCEWLPLKVVRSRILEYARSNICPLSQKPRNA